MAARRSESTFPPTPGVEYSRPGNDGEIDRYPEYASLLISDFKFLLRNFQIFNFCQIFFSK